MKNHTPTKQTQDWQLEAYDRLGKTNRMVRQQRAIREAESKPCTWGVNMSERVK